MLGQVNDRFNSAWLKVGRARKHIDDLEAEIQAFWASIPYLIEEVGSPKTGLGAYRIGGTPKPLPDVIALITGDAAHNLRSALDHFACAAVPVITNHVAFPVIQKPNPTATQWRNEVLNRLPGALQTLIDAVLEIEAYDPGKGRDTVWAVSHLDRVDKHRLVLNVAAAHTAIELDAANLFSANFPDFLPPGQQFPATPFALRPATLERVESGLTLFGVESIEGFKADPKFRFEVLLGEPDPLKDQPVVETLRNLTENIERLLQKLEPLA
jgi:hypothetical protein